MCHGEVWLGHSQIQMVRSRWSAWYGIGHNQMSDIANISYGELEADG